MVRNMKGHGTDDSKNGKQGGSFASLPSTNKPHPGAEQGRR